MACCSRKQGVAGRQTVFGGARPVTLDVPEAFDGNKRYPLLVTLHSRGSNGASGRNTLGLQTAHNYGDGILILSPDGTLDVTSSSFWNATDACCNFYGSTVDDIGYILDLIEDVLAAGWPVDLTRVGVIGYSNGGFLAHMVARCSNKAGGARRITWGCAVNGMGPLPTDSHLNHDGSACAPSWPVHWVQVNGTLDVTVHYLGDSTGSERTGDVPTGAYPGALASAAAWAALNGVTGALGSATYTRDFVQTVAGAESTRQVYAGAPTNGSVTVITLTGEDHVLSMTTGPVLASSWTLSILDEFISHPRIP
jgi:polyhydroxybutyrate depolymerase